MTRVVPSSPPEDGSEIVGGAPPMQQLGRPLQQRVAAPRDRVPLQLASEAEAMLDDGFDATHIGQALDAVGATDARLLGAAERQAGDAVVDETVVHADVPGVELPGDVPAPLVR